MTLRTRDRVIASTPSNIRPSKPRKTGKGSDRETTLTSRVGVLAVMLVSALYFLLPVWWLVVAANKKHGEQFSGSGLWFDGVHIIENVRILMTEGDGIFLRWMLNSILYAGLGATVGTVLSAMAGYALAKYSFPGRGLIFSTILAAVLIPKIMFTLPLFMMFSNVSLINNPLAVLLPSIVSPFGVYLSRVFAAQSVPDELIEAGRLDGAGEFRIFSDISVRVMAPALVTIFLFNFVEIWNNYLLPAMVLNDSALQPVTVGLVAWNGSNGNVPQATVVVGALLSIIPLIVAFLCLQRFWRAGLTAGAVK
ncbi:carbohydrate ABC transporter permease [Pseudarthrobacter sp. SSS035]|uniref:carbohydrate ABC transporter permease n=1 Tax=Pseudarthrobacter sp. SSS035 TaxID=2931399 RepID=UPI00200ED991|nr:carbohydrate ABC transporter permease [Pseudarthrobacter sp. SSS035]